VNFDFIEKPDVEVIKDSLSTMEMIGAIDPVTSVITPVGKIISLVINLNIFLKLRR